MVSISIVHLLMFDIKTTEINQVLSIQIAILPQIIYILQALIYPLTVASKSASVERRDAADHILRNLCEHSSALVEQAMMVSEELIRVAILWPELWAEGLEEASRLYFGEKNVKGMFAVLDPLHLIMKRGPQTLSETSFQQVSFLSFIWEKKL